MATLCLVDVPSGRRRDLPSGAEIDFDQVYESAIAPAIADAGLTAGRSHEQPELGVVHGASLACLILADYVIIDVTLANADVFYELGIRHVAKPYSTVPIFARLHAPPFDVTLLGAIPLRCATAGWSASRPSACERR